MLYLDASALVKRYIEEEGSDELLRTMDGASAWSSCRICFVETVRAVGLVGGSRSIKRVESDWRSFDVVEVDRGLAEQARASPFRQSFALLMPCIWRLRLHYQGRISPWPPGISACTKPRAIRAW